MGGAWLPSLRAQAEEPAKPLDEQFGPFLTSHCVSCHSGEKPKGKLSLALYMAAIPLAFVNEWIADALYAAVALIWLVPDPRIEAKLKE